MPNTQRMHGMLVVDIPTTDQAHQMRWKEKVRRIIIIISKCIFHFNSQPMYICFSNECHSLNEQIILHAKISKTVVEMSL